MEHIGIRTPSFILTPYLLTLAIIGVGFSIFTISTTALGQPTIAPANPYSAFVDIFPGRPESALERRGFSCFTEASEPERDTSEKSCQLTLMDGMFFSIKAVTDEATINQITFVLREDFKVGDLALLLGTHDFQWSLNSIYFSWHGKLGVASIAGGRRSFFRRVLQVAFIDTPPW